MQGAVLLAFVSGEGGLHGPVCVTRPCVRTECDGCGCFWAGVCAGRQSCYHAPLRDGCRAVRSTGTGDRQRSSAGGHGWGSRNTQRSDRFGASVLANGGVEVIGSFKEWLDVVQAVRMNLDLAANAVGTNGSSA